MVLRLDKEEGKGAKGQGRLRSLECRRRRLPSKLLRGEDQRDDQAVQAEHLSEDENEDHADEQTRLLRCASHARVANNADCVSGGQTAQANTQPRSELV